MAIATLEEYLREFSVEIGDRILTSFPALHSPGDPVSPVLGKLLRKPFAAQEVAIAGAVKRLQHADSVAIIAEMGTGKTLMAIAVAHVFSAGSVFLSFHRAAAIAAEDSERNLADNTRREDVRHR